MSALGPVTYQTCLRQSLNRGWHGSVGRSDPVVFSGCRRFLPHYA